MLSQCPTCKRSIQVPDEAVGKKVRCPGCQAVFVMEPEAPVIVLEADLVPAPPSTETTATAPPPAPIPITPLPPIDVNPFALDSPPPDPAASLDFGRPDAKLNQGTRMRLERAGGMMLTGAAISFILAVLMVALSVFFRQSQLEFLLRVVASVAVYSLSIMIILCARSLFVLRSRGLGIAAAIMCLIIAVIGLAVMGMPFVAILWREFMRPQEHIGAEHVEGIVCFGSIIALVALVQIATCLWGGISTLLFIFRPDVAEAIRETQEREARVARNSTGFVHDGCFRAAIWQALMALLMFLNIVVHIAIYWRLSSLRRLDDSFFIEVAVEIGIVVLFMFFNLAALGSLLLKRLFVIPIVGGIACLLAALFSYCGAFVSVPVMLNIHDATMQLILTGHAVVMLLTNIVGIGGFITALDASRLIRKFGGDR